MPYRISFAGSELLRGNHSKAACHAYHEAYDEEHDGACGSDGSESVLSDVFSDDDRVGKVVELLYDVPDHHRDQEAHYEFKGFSLCHVDFHVCLHILRKQISRVLNAITLRRFCKVQKNAFEK